jgi:hypothetical protein
LRCLARLSDLGGDKRLDGYGHVISPR